jgi:hypothetical protein
MSIMYYGVKEYAMKRVVGFLMVLLLGFIFISSAVAKDIPIEKKIYIAVININSGKIIKVFYSKTDPGFRGLMKAVEHSPALMIAKKVKPLPTPIPIPIKPKK